MVAPIGGFGRFKSNVGETIGGLALSNYQDEMNMAGSALAARSKIKAAEAGADATRFAGEQMANATMFGGIMGGVSGLASGVIGGLGKMNAANSAKAPSYSGSASSVGSFADGSAWGQGNSGIDWSNKNLWNGSAQVPGSWTSGVTDFSGGWAKAPSSGWGLTGW